MSDEEKQTIDSVHFDALAYGVFENAFDADSGRAALVQAYNAYNWNDPVKAKDSLEYYGEAIQNKYKDQSPPVQNIEEEAPVKLSDIPVNDLKSDEELFTKWRETNLAYLNDTNLQPQFAVAKKDYIKQVNAHADNAIREAHVSSMKNVLGEAGAAATETFYRELRGLTAFASPAINAVTGFDLNNFLTSYTDPQTDGAFLSSLAEGLGNVASIVAAPGTVAQSVVIGAPVIPAIKNRYDETLSATGDPSLATKAAAVETGVQGLQVAGGTIFAKMGGAAAKTGLKAIGMEAVTQANIQAGAHVLGNVATNIQTQQDQTFENVTEGIGQAAGIGAVLGGGVKAIHSAFPTYDKPQGPYTVKSKANTAQRATEVEQDGTPTTPIKTQAVGNINEPTNENVIPAEGGIVTELSKVPKPSTPAFTTEDGNQWYVGPSGQYVKEGTLPHDRTPFVDEKTAQKVAGAITSGEHVYIKDGAPVIERVADDGSITHEPIEHTNDPIEGTYPLNISGEKKTSNQQIVRPVQLGQRIKEVQLDRSVGAASAVTETLKESTYSQKLRESSLPEPMKAVGEEGIFYKPITLPGVGTETNAFVREAGIDGAIAALKDSNVSPVLRSGVANYLHNYFGTKISEAFAKGNVEEAQRIGEDFKAIAPDVSAQGTKTAQALRVLSDKNGLDPLKIRDTYERAYEKALVEEGKAAGVDPLEIGEAKKQAQQIDEQIKAVKENTPEGKEAATKNLEAKKEKLNDKVARQKTAEATAVKAAQDETANQVRIKQLKDVLKNDLVTGNKRHEIESDIATREAASEAPNNRFPWFPIWVRNQIAGGYNGIVALMGGLSIPLDAVSLLAKDIATGDIFTGKSEGLAYLKGVTDKDALLRGLALAKIAWKTGERLENTIPREELTVLGGKFKVTPKAPDYTTTIKNFSEYAKNLKYGEGLAKDFTTLIAKSSGFLTEPFIKFLALNEALVYSAKHSAFDRAAAAHYYNKGVKEGVTPEELIQYQYSPKANWELAQAEAKNQTDILKAAGIETTKEQQYLNAVEKYQEKAPREIQKSAFKQAAQAVTTGPAGGYAGVVADLIKLGVDSTGGDRSPVKFLAPFANSIANLTSMHMAFTPIGAIDSIGPSNRTSFERSLIRAQAATGTIAGLATLGFLRSQMLQNPDKDPYVTIIGNYSADKAKRDAYIQSGGQLNAVKVGDTYFPFGEAPWALWAYGIGRALDNIRDGKDPDPVTSTVAWHSSVTMAVGMLGGAGGLNMLRSITDIGDAIQSVVKGDQNADVALVRSLVTPVKGFIPGASLFRTAARWFDNPVEARKDIVSALVQGIPGLQSAYGKPSLNIFGEVMKPSIESDVLGLYRVFSSGRTEDLDIRWLTDNGYEVPGINNMRFSKKLQAVVESQKDADDATELDYNFKYKVFTSASSDLRGLVSQYRNTLSTSAYNPKAQDALRKDFNRILAIHAADLVQ